MYKQLMTPVPDENSVQPTLDAIPRGEPQSPSSLRPSLSLANENPPKPGRAFPSALIRPESATKYNVFASLLSEGADGLDESGTVSGHDRSQKADRDKK